MTPTSSPPVVLIVAGNDPSGGAGIQADIQAVSALGAHPAPVITALTVQDTKNAYEVLPLDPAFVGRQIRAVLDDLSPAAVKIGLLATPDIARETAGILRERSEIPVILDPVLFAAGGARLAEIALRDVLLEELIPRARLVTPNADEIRELADGAQDNDARALELIDRGADYVLVKGADESTPDVRNTLFDRDGVVERFTWRRLPHTYHGSGCTLASAVAALTARGLSMPEAVRGGQRYTDRALAEGFRPGGGQHVPRRIFDVPDRSS